MKKPEDNNKPEPLSRKEFLRRTGKMAIGAAVAPWLINTACSSKAAEAGAEGTTTAKIKETQMWIAKNAGPAELTRKAVDGAGGMGKFVSEGDKVALVPNIAWARAPEYAANTNPDVVRTLTKMCFEAGLYTNAVISPAVPPDKGMLRTSYMATHTDEQIDRALDILGVVGRELGLID